MYRAIALIAFVISGWANALTLSPMYRDELVYQDLYVANFQLENTADSVRYYDVWVTKTPESPTPSVEDGFYKGEEVLGGNEYRQISAVIFNLAPDELGVYYVCVQERPENGGAVVVGRVCAKLRLYWPRAELLKLP